MSTRTTARALLVTVVLLWPAAAPAGPPGEVAPPAAAIASAVEAARSGEAAGFRLRVDSLSASGGRSLEVFPSGIAIWSGSVQVAAGRALRSAMLSALLDAGFPTFASSYGGRPEEATGDGGLRVVRRVALEVGGLSKSSVQLADGEQSAALERLAEALLDLAAPLAGTGVTAGDLADGLTKLEQGVLAPETLSLRLVDLPAPGSTAVGSILRIEAGIATRQPYAPGRTVGELVPLELGRDRLAALAASIRAADLASLPANVWSDAHLELEVRLLQHGRAVVARPFSRRSADEDDAARRRFEGLIEALRALGAGG